MTSSKMNIAIIMMQKNELDLFPIWIKYHGELVGYNNIYVFDNGSDEYMESLLGKAEEKGVNIDRNHKTGYDFENKGNIIAKKIRELDKLNIPHDFYFPIDCDEFIGVEKQDGEVSINRKDIVDTLMNYIKSPDILMIKHGFDNHPSKYSLFGRKGRRKCFFAQGSCRKLSLGFHTGKAYHSEKEVRTNIVYFHFHNKPIDLLKFHSLQKLENRVSNFLLPTLIKHRNEKRRGSHLINHLLFKDEIDYENEFERLFPKTAIRNIDVLTDKLINLGFSDIFNTNYNFETTGKSTNKILLVDFRFGSQVCTVKQIPVFAKSIFTNDIGYGWLSVSGLKVVNRDGGDQTHQSIIMSNQSATFRLILAPGRYRIEIVCGDLKGVIRNISIEIPEHKLAHHNIQTNRNEFANVSFGVKTETGVLNIVLSSTDSKWAINSLRIYSANNIGDYGIIRYRVFTDRWVKNLETDLGPKAIFNKWFKENINTPVSQTKMTRLDYVDFIESAVDYFTTYQDDDGAIIDPYKMVEFQYATPCYAYAAALVAKYKGRKDLISKSILAFKKSAIDLSNRTAANGHEDFYPSPLAHAYKILSELIPSSDLYELSKPLTEFNPYDIYRKPPGGRGGSGSNWNCKALAGHQLLYNLGLKKNGVDYEYVVESILAQGWLFTSEFGTYMEGPSTYDSFPRAWLSDMIEWGYSGPKSAELEDALERGAITSLFLQSPTGELVHGGRSSHHLWADALQCVIFEIFSARSLRKGNVDLAGVFKRAARRALTTFKSWRRPSGELWIVKNKFDPVMSHGFEVYSSHSQYNLLAMTALGYAFEHAEATETIQEKPTPAEVGTSLLSIPKPVDFTLGTACGTQVVHLAAMKEHQNVIGLLKVSMQGVAFPLPIPDNIPRYTNYLLPNKINTNIACGLYWSKTPIETNTLNGLNCLADHEEKGQIHRDIRLNGISNKTLDYSIIYNINKNEASPCRIEEQIFITDGVVEIRYLWSDWHGDMTLLIPVYVSDGLESTLVSRHDSSLQIRYRNTCVEFSAQNTQNLVKNEIECFMRVGKVDIYTFKALKNSSSLLLKIKKYL